MIFFEMKYLILFQKSVYHTDEPYVNFRQIPSIKKMDMLSGLYNYYGNLEQSQTKLKLR